MMDPTTHKRYLEYREKFEYFARGADKVLLTAAQFIALDAEARALDAKGEDGRDDEEEARFLALLKVLIRD